MNFRRAAHFDVTESDRTPAEESFYESYLLRKHSDVGNLYSSNVYEGQCYEKTIKQINRDRKVQAAEIDREMKKLQKKMNALRTRSDSARFLNHKRSPFACQRDFVPDDSDTYGSLALPLLSPSNQRRGSNMPSGGKAVTSTSLKDRGNRAKPRLAASSIQPLIQISNCEPDSAETTDNNNNGGAVDNYEKNSVQLDSNSCLGDCNNPVKARGPNAFFVTDVAEMCSASIPKNSPKLDRLATTRSVTRLSPIFNARINGSSPKAEMIRAVQSEEDLLTLDHTGPAIIPRRMRSHTISGYVAELGSKNFEMSYSLRDDRASSAGFPKI